MSARRSVLRRRRWRLQESACGMVLRGAAAQDEAGRPLDRLLGRRRGQIAISKTDAAVKLAICHEPGADFVFQIAELTAERWLRRAQPPRGVMLLRHWALLPCRRGSRLREFAQYLYPDSTTAAPKLPKWSSV